MGPDLPEEDNADEKACSERIAYWLKKYGCTMIPVMELRPGEVRPRIDIVKIPPEALKQMKAAEKAQSNERGFAAPSA